MRLIAQLIVIGICSPFLAAADEMSEVHAAGHWSGCVFQEGFDPYPIRISPRPAPTLQVEYPNLCTGYHTPREEGWPSDAVEVITKSADICIPSVDLDYSFQDGLLRIDYLIAGNPYALLQRVDPKSKTPSCEPSELSS